MRPAGHDWRRTHAVVVAVEQYATRGEGWDLDGPANDAARMMRWLRGRGVPEDHMHLLASPLERNEGLLAEFTGVRRSTADRMHVRRVFQDELRALDVDWLWVYWAGHGIQAAHNRWSLLYPESRDGDPQGADAENLISLLRTDRLPARAAQRAVVVLDACRTTLKPGEQAHAADPDTLTNRTEANVERPLFVMRASRPGQAAKSVHGVGLFTSKLMDELEAGSRRDPAAAPDLDRVWQGIRSHFDELAERDGAGQVPTALCRNWTSDEDYAPRRLPAAAKPPAERNPARDGLALLVRAALADDGPALARVARKLGTHLAAPLPCEPAEIDAVTLVDWARTRPHGIATLIHLLAAAPCGLEPADLVSMKADGRRLAPDRWLLCAEYDTLMALLEAQPEEVAREFTEAARKEAVGTDLTATAPREVVDALEALLPDLPRLPRLLGTVERAAAAAGDGPYAEALRQWSDACARRLDAALPAVLADRRATLAEQAAAAGTADERVQIRLSAPSGPAGHRTYQVWTHGASGAESVEVRDTPVAPAAIERAVDTLLARHGRVNSTPVEFFLDARDLELDVHRWQIGSDGPFERSLGAEFPVAVRCTEHRRPQQEHLWRGRWEQVAHARTGDLHWLPGDLPTMKAAHGLVSAREDAPGVVVTAHGSAAGSAAPRTDVFTACVFGGVPVMVWCGHGEPDRAAEELKNLLTDCPLPELPARLRRLRADCDGDDTHPRGGLALLWDDPERQLPPRLDLSAP
ncbi:caspase family protein [Streptomyces sp. NPDC059783]|uniref:VMAP-C domain-containing protein n=1 Tax=Streptomyces sp. NPDC059783 TaxID=3346944 RepID=UPI0036558497